MGYTTEFDGEFLLDRQMAPEHVAYLNAFTDTRRIARYPQTADGFMDPLRTTVGLPIGDEAGYYVGTDTISIMCSREPPRGQPSLQCHWIVSDDGKHIKWNGEKKFNNYVKWIRYLRTHFLVRWGYALNGTVHWRGKDFDDMGVIIVADNVVTTRTLRFRA